MPRVTVGPKTGGGWQVSGEGSDVPDASRRRAGGATEARDQRRWRTRREGPQRTDPLAEHRWSGRPAALDGLTWQS
jgi:hypothetical protein